MSATCCSTPESPVAAPSGGSRARAGSGRCGAGIARGDVLERAAARRLLASRPVDAGSRERHQAGHRAADRTRSVCFRTGRGGLLYRSYQQQLAHTSRRIPRRSQRPEDQRPCEGANRQSPGRRPAGEVLVATPELLECNGLPVIAAAGLEAGLIQMIRPAWNIMEALCQRSCREVAGPPM